MQEVKVGVNSGIVGGLAGGMVFGMLMFMMGVMPMIAMMVGSESIIIGWMLHILISVITGVFFVIIFSSQIKNYTSALVFGMIYGLVWWVLGALVAMPVILGMGLQFSNMFDQMHLMSLMGHAIFGILLGVVSYWNASRTA
jgi:hypothetical protein